MATEYTGEVIPIGGQEYTGEVLPLKTGKPTSPTFGEKAGALAYGAGTGFLGGLGELEEFGAYTVPEFLGLQEKGKRDNVLGTGRETIFPTVKEVQQVLKKVGIEKPREEVSGYQTAGEVLGGLGPSIPGLTKGLGKALLGGTTKIGEASAQAAERLGFKLSPSQVRAEGPVGERGAIGFTEHNQDLANKLASKGTGKEVKFVDDVFIGERLEDLGKSFDKVYQGKKFNVDPDAMQAIQQIANEEAAAIGRSGVSAVKSAADDILKNYRSLIGRSGAEPSSFAISGEGLQKLRNALTAQARTTSRGKAREIYELVDVVDASIARNHPDVAKTLETLRPQYRNSIILEDLFHTGGISRGDISLQRLGDMLKRERSAVRRTKQDIDELGKIGRDNRIKARWETPGQAQAEGQETMRKALGLDVPRVLSYPLRSRPARALQRNLEKIPTVPAAGATAAGTAARPFQDKKQ